MEDFMLELDGVFFKMLMLYMPLTGFFLFMLIKKNWKDIVGERGVWFYFVAVIIIFMSLYSLPFTNRYSGAF